MSLASCAKKGKFNYFCHFLLVIQFSIGILTTAFQEEANMSEMLYSFSTLIWPLHMSLEPVL